MALRQSACVPEHARSRWACLRVMLRQTDAVNRGKATVSQVDCQNQQGACQILYVSVTLHCLFDSFSHKQ